LRERKEDIPLLIDHFMKPDTNEVTRQALSGEMLEAMVRHDWPGNVRELQNVLQRYRSLNRFDLLEDATCQFPKDGMEPSNLPVDLIDHSYHAAMGGFEKQFLLRALENNQWRRDEAARSMGLPLRTFYRKLKRHGLIRHKK
nr:helix-turn-helix domain-containing protein [Desulfobacterales bacterium]